MKISLLVIRCQDIEASQRFYQKLGLSFVKEKHGDGLTHYSCEHDGCVFELYPNEGEAPTDNIRIGFRISTLASVIDNIAVDETYAFEGRKVYLVKDPDGRKVEISE